MPGAVTRVRWEAGLPVAEVATCPICTTECVAPYATNLNAPDLPAGTLISWPGHPTVTACRHYRGAYSGGGTAVEMHFTGVPQDRAGHDTAPPMADLVPARTNPLE